MSHLPPIYITFMLNCYFAANPAEALGFDHWDSPAGQETRSWLRSNDLIDDSSKATARGRAWVAYICATPLPESKWILPERVQ